MFTCVMNTTVNISIDSINWWRIRIDIGYSLPLQIRTRSNNIFSIASNISGGILTSVLMITGLRSALIGPYWVEVANGTQLSDMAFLSIVASGTYVCIYVQCMYV